MVMKGYVITDEFIEKKIKDILGDQASKDE